MVVDRKRRLTIIIIAKTDTVYNIFLNNKLHLGFMIIFI